MSEAESGAAGTPPPDGGDPAPPRMGAVPHRLDPLPVEARPFQGQRAGIVTRTAANVIDFLDFGCETTESLTTNSSL